MRSQKKNEELNPSRLSEYSVPLPALKVSCFLPRWQLISLVSGAPASEKGKKKTNKN